MLKITDSYRHTLDHRGGADNVESFVWVLSLEVVDPRSFARAGEANHQVHLALGPCGNAGGSSYTIAALSNLQSTQFNNLDHPGGH